MWGVLPQGPSGINMCGENAAPFLRSQSVANLPEAAASAFAGAAAHTTSPRFAASWGNAARLTCGRDIVG